MEKIKNLKTKGLLLALITLLFIAFVFAEEIEGVIEVLDPDGTIVATNTCVGDYFTCEVTYNSCLIEGWYTVKFTAIDTITDNAYYCECPTGQESCLGWTGNLDPVFPFCCLPGYYCTILGTCSTLDEYCSTDETRGLYQCFSDGLYTNPYACLGIEEEPNEDEGCCYKCTGTWDYSCWESVVIY